MEQERRDTAIDADELVDTLDYRHLPLLFIINADGDLLQSSFSSSNFLARGGLATQLLLAIKSLIHNAPFTLVNHTKGEKNLLKKQKNSCLPVSIGGVFYSVRLLPLCDLKQQNNQAQYAAVVEQAAHHSDGVNYDMVKETFHLSCREIEVIQALLLGDTDKVIARAIGISPETVRGYLKSIRAKLRVSTRTAIVHVVHELSTHSNSL